MEEVKIKHNNKKKKGLKVLFCVMAVITTIVLISVIHTQICVLLLNKYIDSFGSVEYDHAQIIPVKDENGYYTFTTDNDLKIMEINDIHLGGGRWSFKKDKKTVYEVMSMVKQEKPDFIVLNGDNTFCVPAIAFNGGGTFNNKMVAKEVIRMFETLGVYWTTTFGNHDTEAFDFYNRKEISELYSDESYKYCIYDANFTEYGESNQCILVKNTSGDITKALMMIDSNDYIDKSLSATINWLYDTIHDNQVEWAKNTLETLSSKNGNKVKCLVFCHIPVGEFEVAYRELESNSFNNTTNTSYVSGVWDELVDSEMGGRIWYGGCYKKDVKPEDNDKLFEELGPDGIDSLEAIIVGHDHVNDAAVIYKGVYLMYGKSIDNLAYEGINKFGKQRGCLVINLKNDGSWTKQHKNMYVDYDIDSNKFYEVNYNDYMYEGVSNTPGK